MEQEHDYCKIFVIHSSRRSQAENWLDAIAVETRSPKKLFLTALACIFPCFADMVITLPRST